MTETVTNAVARRDSSPSGVIEQYRADLTVMLPEHIKGDAWVRLAMGVFRRDKALADAATANPSSMMSALLDAARQGLEPGTPQYYLTTRKVKGRPEVQGMRGYQGEIELIYRAGAVSSVIVEVVREKDLFRYSPGRDERPIHEIDWDAEDRGALRLVYAYGIMKDGATSKVVVLNKQHIKAIRAQSQGADSAYSPWNKWEESMWLKSAAHQLQKWVPTSAEYIREQLRAQRDVAAEPVQIPQQPAPRYQPATEAPVDVSHLPEAEPVYDAELVTDRSDEVVEMENS
jgi:recombination protein RecT